MSYRTRINDMQIFGNNESYPEWDAFIRSQGIRIDEEGCYDGEVYDFMAMARTLEDIVARLMKERRDEWADKKNSVEKVLSKDPENAWGLREKANMTRSYLDFSGYETDLSGDCAQPLLDILFQIAHEAYAFFPYAAYAACRDQLEPADPVKYGSMLRVRTFRFKPGMSAHVHAG